MLKTLPPGNDIISSASRLRCVEDTAAQLHMNSVTDSCVGVTQLCVSRLLVVDLCGLPQRHWWRSTAVKLLQALWYIS